MRTKINIEISESEVLNFLKGLDTDDIITLHNLYCELIGFGLGSRYIYHNTEEGISEAFDHEPREIIKGLQSNLYNSKEKYFSVLDNGKMISYELITQIIYVFLAKSILENFDHYKAFIRFDIRIL